MLLKLERAAIYDPVQGLAGELRDLFVRDGVIVDDPGTVPDEVIDLGGRIAMAGAIDIHSHIAGGKVNVARLLLPEDHRHYPGSPGPACACGGGHAAPTTSATGHRYIEMGFTAAFEPAMLGSNARHAHLELEDIPFLDNGAYLVLGNDDLFLDLVRRNADPQEIADTVAWMLHASQALAVKSVNPGGINAFKFNKRRLDLDEPGPYYDATPRRILTALARAVHDLGLPHPLHLHGCNLGVPGNVETTLSTIGGAEGLPLHMTHIQFHSYGAEGDRHFSSGAARIAEVVNGTLGLTVDVGQVMFGQTITASADTMAQARNAGLGTPRRWLSMDIEMDAGCGVIPFRYRDKSFVNALQWAIGLELFLLIRDPWRVFLTTDHPNGAPFACYPRLIRLLMDRNFRNAELERLHPDLPRHTILPDIAREYTLSEIAVMTRAAPARILGLSDRGHLGPGAVGDITVYSDLPDREAMFAAPDLVFKNGTLVVRNGKVVRVVQGATHVVRPDYDPVIERRIAAWFDRTVGIKAQHFRVADHEIRGGAGPVVHPCTGPASIVAPPDGTGSP